ncbi:MAG: t-SNARE complex subunit, syntaxin [Amphiamblys sp. WSBS2006]|nr:MAG: t-SNARE complex subunit, syntaxin [Amphiamblys sp. WSBS2006]
MALDLLARLTQETGERKIIDKHAMDLDQALERGYAYSGGPDDTVKIKNFLNMAKEIKALAKQTGKTTADMELLYKKMLSTEDSKEIEKTQQQLKELQDTQDRAMTEIRKVLEALERENNEVLKDPANTNKRGEIRMRTAHYPYLCKLFSNGLRKHQEMQMVYKEKSKALIERKYRSLSPKATNKDIERIFASDENKKKVFQEELGNIKGDAKQTLEAMDTRLSSMHVLEENIVTISKLFLDMQNIIVSQGAVLNKIEEEIGTATEHVDTAVEEVKEAQGLADSIRRRKFYLTLLIFFGLLILVGVVYKTILIDMFGINPLKNILG